MANKRSGKWFYIIGGILLSAWFLSHVAETGSHDVSSGSPPSVAPATPGFASVSAPPANSPTIASILSSSAPTPGPSAFSTPITIKPTVAATPQATPIPESHPPSDNYVPKEVRLTSYVSFPIMENGSQIGLRPPPVGTKVKLLKITGYNVLVEYKGQQKSISASSTDLLDRMLGTTND